MEKATCRGTVYIVGGGPGDPGLITVKGLSLLRKADVVVYDRLAPQELLGEVKEGCRLVFAGKAAGRHSMSQEEINRLLLEEACKGRIVVRLKGGDPYFYGRGEEECLYLLERGIRCEVVPGVPSVTAVPECAGIPVASRLGSSTLAIAPGRRAGGGGTDLRGIAGAVDTLIVLMGASNIAEILEEIAAARGWGEKAAVIMDGTTRRQRVIAGDLRSIASRASEVSAPAILVVGRIVELRDKLWRIS